ncbi:lysosomal Pro-X carboxypeptidase [Sitophilus oryzae]|uniref:Lysosomal Pro-X carboxypeptidase n=1 Tax=Sitophilus oryzae TaxID=7048 RepID=A0A6J2XBI5_SITOR|nr:lysosomal Pro-X carboxypeptidase [Sitophilus oryzae]
MKYYILFIFFCFVCCDEYGFDTKYIEVPLDHFSFTNNKTFKLRYLVNDSYYVDNHPIFFYTGNEGDISMFAQNTGFMFDLAKQFDSLIIFAEHRYYGETLPFGNLSYSSPEYLGYLSAQQALADFVYLIDDLQQQYANKSSLEKVPVVAFGGSYGGMLSSWLRMKYPYSVTGAIASSAPIWQFKGLTPCENFNKVTTDVVRSLGSEKCVETIKKIWSIIRSKTNTTEGKITISKEFSLCQNLTSQNDVEVLLNWVNEVITNMVMVNYPYPTSFLVPLPGNPVREFCSKVDSVEYKDDDGVLKAITTGLEIYTNYTGTTKCNDILQTASSSLGETGWNFQSCTDMIMPMCSTDEDMFENSEWDFKKFSDDCYEQYKVRPRNEEVPILEFGGKNIETASNIVFSNGLLDPWSSGGVLQNVSSEIAAIVIPDGAHHFDLRGSNALDSESVQNARKFHQNQIKKWLHQFYFKENKDLYYYYNSKRYD